MQNVARSTFCDRFLLKCAQSAMAVPLDCLYFKRKRSQKVGRATFCTEWKSPFNPVFLIRQAFTEDWFGLGTLAKRNAIHTFTFEDIKHTSWHGSEVVFDKAIKQWLT